MISKTFKIISILSGITVMVYITYSWNDYSNKSIEISQILLMFMFVFGGLDQLLSNKKAMKRIGFLWLAVAILIASGLLIHFVW